MHSKTCTRGGEKCRPAPPHINPLLTCYRIYRGIDVRKWVQKPFQFYSHEFTLNAKGKTCTEHQSHTEFTQCVTLNAKGNQVLSIKDIWILWSRNACFYNVYCMR